MVLSLSKLLSNVLGISLVTYMKNFYSTIRLLLSLLFSLHVDNGPHYHNTGVLTYLSEVNDVFNVHLMEYNNFEAGEGKTVLDTHFAHISHKIVRYVRLSNDLEAGEEVGQLIQVNCI